MNFTTIRLNWVFAGFTVEQVSCFFKICQNNLLIKQTRVRQLLGEYVWPWKFMGFLSVALYGNGWYSFYIIYEIRRVASCIITPSWLNLFVWRTWPIHDQPGCWQQSLLYRFPNTIFSLTGKKSSFYLKALFQAWEKRKL